MKTNSNIWSNLTLKRFVKISMTKFELYNNRSVMLIIRARTFRSSDMKTVRRVLSRCYLGDWWVLYQLGRNSNTHFFRYLLRHIEKQMFNSNGDLATRTLKKPPLPGGGLRRSPQRLSHLRTLAPEELNGHSVDDESEDEDISTVEGQHLQHTMRKRPKVKKISMPYTVWNVDWMSFISY